MFLRQAIDCDSFKTVDCKYKFVVSDHKKNYEDCITIKFHTNPYYVLVSFYAHRFRIIKELK